jgi:DNA repair exonuclease SbcCD ATPase subunit
MFKRPLFIIPALSLVSLAGCSNSPVPDAYTPPEIPEMYTIPTPTPVPSVTLDTNAFINQGEQLNALEKRVIVVPTTEMDKYIYNKTRFLSFNNLMTSLFNEVDASNTSLADDFLIKRADLIKKLTSLITTLFRANPQLSSLMGPNNGSDKLSEQLQDDLVKYATLKYRITTNTVDHAAARSQMAALRARSINKAVQVDRLAYRYYKAMDRALNN